MNAKELQAAHPETYDAIFATGEAKERGRVNALLKMGATYKAPDIAAKAIASGATLSGNDELLAEFLTAGKNAEAQAARQEDSDTAGAIVSGKAPAPAPGGTTLLDQFAADLPAKKTA